MTTNIGTAYFEMTVDEGESNPVKFAPSGNCQLTVTWTGMDNNQAIEEAFSIYKPLAMATAEEALRYLETPELRYIAVERMRELSSDYDLQSYPPLTELPGKLNFIYLYGGLLEANDLVFETLAGVWATGCLYSGTQI